MNAPLVLLLSTVQQAIAMRLVVQRVKSASVVCGRAPSFLHWPWRRCACRPTRK